MRSGLPWLSVLTCPARPNYLVETIEAIDAAGGYRFPGTKVVCVDGDPLAIGASARVNLRTRGWAVGPAHDDNRLHGSAAAMRTILGAAHTDEAPYLLYFEDDLILCRNAIDVMCRMAVPFDYWALQFCDLKRLGPPASLAARYGHTVTAYDTDHHWGNQALKIPRWTLDRVSTSTVTHDHPRGHSSDVLLGKMARSDIVPYLGIVAPSVVQHIGSASICNPNRELSEYGRSAHNFPGVDFDARRLFGGE